uniref:Uncharacterized protein n=1 Tax=Anguilla anguilla TaxID=7936 RepID=A0A0E9SAJ1_ANGAN
MERFSRSYVGVLELHCVRFPVAILTSAVECSVKNIPVTHW